MRRISRITPSPAMIVALTALVAAAGGTAWAASAIDGKLLKDRTVAGKKLTKHTVTNAEVKAHTLTGTEINFSKLGTVPSAAKLGSTPASGFLRYGSTIPSGKTVTGAWECQRTSDTLCETTESFPVPAPVALTDATVNFTSSAFANLTETDGDAACTGSFTNPTAPAGKVCIYPSFKYGLDTISGEGRTVSGTDGKRGFVVHLSTSPAGALGAGGAWAYTAP